MGSRNFVYAEAGVSQDSCDISPAIYEEVRILAWRRKYTSTYLPNPPSRLTELDSTRWFGKTLIRPPRSLEDPGDARWHGLTRLSAFAFTLQNSGIIFGSSSGAHPDFCALPNWFVRFRLRRTPRTSPENPIPVTDAIGVSRVLCTRTDGGRRSNSKLSSPCLYAHVPMAYRDQTNAAPAVQPAPAMQIPVPGLHRAAGRQIFS